MGCRARIVSLGRPGTVTRPGFPGCLNRRCEHAVRRGPNQASLRISPIVTRAAAEEVAVAGWTLALILGDGRGGVGCGVGNRDAKVLSGTPSP